MKRFFMLLVLLWAIKTEAQSPLQFTIQQLPLLIADAGKDTSVLVGQKVRLGGTTPASGGTGFYTYTWSPAVGLDTPTVAHPIATADTTITYTLTVDDGKGCQKTSSIRLQVQRVTAIDPVADQLGLVIAPNPNQGTFYIKTQRPVGERKLKLEIFDLTGRLLYSEVIPGGRLLNQTIRLTSKGYYLLTLNGQQLRYTQRIIIQ